MTFKPFTAAIAVLLAGAANASTQNFYYSVMDTSSQDVGFLMISESPGYRQASLSLDATPQYDFAFGFNPNHRFPVGDIQLEFNGGVLSYFEIDLSVCNPNYSDCNFSKVWFIDGDANRGSVFITNYPADPNTYSYTLTATVPEPPYLALILTGTALVGLTIRRRKS